MATSLPIIFSEVAQAKNKEKKKEVLKKYNSKAPPITKFQGDTDEPNPTYLYYHVRKLYLFVEGGREGLTDMKREMLFTEILEGIHPSEVELLLQVKDKKIKCRGLTYNLVKETYPELLPWVLKN